MQLGEGLGEPQGVVAGNAVHFVSLVPNSPEIHVGDNLTIYVANDKFPLQLMDGPKCRIATSHQVPHSLCDMPS